MVYALLIKLREWRAPVAERHPHRNGSHRSQVEPDLLDFDHHREERHHAEDASRPDQVWVGHTEHALEHADFRWRDEGGPRSFSSGSQEFGPQGYGGGYGQARYGAREWTGTEAWRVPGPFTGWGPRGYQRSDERIREELNDRLTAHGFIDATDIECRVFNGEVTLSGSVDSREAKRAAEDVAAAIQGVHDVHNNLRVRSREGAERVVAPNARRPLAVRTRVRPSARAANTKRARVRTK
jgi:hypothetical protein